MKKIPTISDAELQVMKLIWERHPVTASEIVEILQSTNDWSPTTIYTFINRLVKKQAVCITKGKSSNICTPLISLEEYRKRENKSFLKKIYNGSLKLMVTSMVEDHDLSEEEIAELRKYLDDKR